MAKAVSPTFKQKLLQTFALEKAFIVFSAVYFPVALLLQNRGTLPEIILAIYTKAMVVVGLIMLAKFTLTLGKFANQHRGNMGDMWVVYVVDALIPMLMFKYFALVVVGMMPKIHYGIWCDIKFFVINLINIFQVQTALTQLITYSFALMGVAAVVAIFKGGRD